MLDVGCGSGVLSIAAAKLGFAPVLALDFDPQAVEATRGTPPTTASSIDVLGRRAPTRSPDAQLALANIAAEAVARARAQVPRAARDHLRLPRLRRAAARRLPHRAARAGRRLGCGSARPSVAFRADGDASPSSSWAARSRRPTRRRCASGCSRDGHARRRAPRRRGRQHLLRHERGPREVAPGRLARRAGRRACLRHRLRREPRPAFAGLPGERHGRARPERGTRRSRRRRRRRHRLHPGRPPARPHPRVREGAGRLLVLVRFCVIPSCAARAQPRAPRPSWPRSAGGSRRATARSCSPGVNLGCFRDRERGYACPTCSCARRRDRRGGARTALVDRGQPPDDALSPRCARRRPSARTCTCRCSPATTACCGRWRGATRAETFLRKLERARRGLQPDAPT